MKKLILIVFLIGSIGASAQNQGQEISKFLNHTVKYSLYDEDPTANNPGDSATIRKISLFNFKAEQVFLNRYEIAEKEKGLKENNYTYSKDVYVFEDNYKFGDAPIDANGKIQYVDKKSKSMPFVFYTFYKENGKIYLIVLQGRENSFF
jgi:hypothetical protein